MEERILGVVKEQVREDATLDNKFTELDMDEVDRVELVMALEEEFNLEIPDEDAEKWNCVRDVISYVTVKKEGEKK